MTRRKTLLGRVLAVAMATLVFMFLYEIAKEFFFSGMTKWESHALTIFAVTLMTAITVGWSFRRSDIQNRQRERYGECLSDLRRELLDTDTLDAALQLITSRIGDVFDADFARIWIIQEADLCCHGCFHAALKEGPNVCRDRTVCLHLKASSGRYTHIDGDHRRVPLGCYKIGRVAAGEESLFVTNDVIHDPRVHNHEWAASLGLVSFAGFRLLATDNKPIGVLALFSKRKISALQRNVLEDLANTASQVIQAGIAKEALKKALGQMERQVVERTAELSRANETLRTEIAERRRAEESSSVFSQAVEHSPLAIIITSAQGIIEYVNPKFTQTTGYERAEAIGQSPRILKSGLMPQAFYKTLWETIAAGGEWSGELQNRKKNGELFWEQAVITGLKNSSGEIVHFVGLKQDITAQKRAQEALRDSEERTRAIYEGSSDAIMLLSERGFFDCNQKTLDMFGYASKEAFVRIHPADISPPNQPNGAPSLAAAQEKIREAFSKGYNRFEWMHRRATGEDFPAEVLLSAFDYGGQRVLQATVRNISKRKQAENALRASEERTNAILESVPAGIFIVENISSEIVSVNPSAVAMLGTPPEKVFGTAWQSYLKPCEKCAAQPRQSDEQSLRSRCILQAAAGAQIPVLVTEVPLWLEDQELSLISFTDISDLQRAEDELAALNRQLMDASREAGMADVASAVLHNVGNVLNSVNVSATLISQTLQDSKVASIHKVTELLQANAPDWGRFFAEDPRGQRLPSYLEKLSGHLREEQALLRKEIEDLVRNIDHIKDIVSMQQAYASTSGVVETVAMTDLIEDAVRMNAAAFSRHDVEVERDFQDKPVLQADRHKVLQILVNLLRNAKYALDECSHANRRLILQVRVCADNRVRVAVIDNGVGISPENLTRIFVRGFTTRKGGHGFGLHSGALAAKEMGGSLTACSAGLGQGASFTLELPMQAVKKGAI